jgi:hypothetical protein
MSDITIVTTVAGSGFDEDITASVTDAGGGTTRTIVTTVAGSGFAEGFIAFKPGESTGFSREHSDAFTFSDGIVDLVTKERFTQQGVGMFQEGLTSEINPTPPAGGETISREHADSFVFTDQIVASKRKEIITIVTGGTFTDNTRTLDTFTR